MLAIRFKLVVGGGCDVVAPPLPPLLSIVVVTASSSLDRFSMELNAVLGSSVSMVLLREERWIWVGTLGGDDRGYCCCG